LVNPLLDIRPIPVW